MQRICSQKPRRYINNRQQCVALWNFCWQQGMCRNLLRLELNNHLLDWQTGADADIEKYSKRTVRVTPQHNEECRRLLRLMGVPVVEVCPKQHVACCLYQYCIIHIMSLLIIITGVQAPSEAEAQCAQMCKEGLVRLHLVIVCCMCEAWLLHD